MKIIQLNVWGGRLEIQIAKLLQSEKADFICLQEAVSLQGASNGGFFFTVEEMQEMLEMELAYSPTALFNFMSRTAGFGNAILSKLPVKSTTTIFTEKQLIENFDVNKDDYNVRNLLHTTYDLDDGQLHVLTHHGHHIPSHKNGDEETLRQCKMIAEYVSKLEGKVILTGDFNLAPHSESIEQINKILTNACITYDVPTTRSHLTHKKEVCDFIFTNENVTVKGFAVSDEVVSDHCALIMEFV